MPFLLSTPVCFSVPIPRSIFFYLSNFHTISLPVSLKSNFFSPPLSLPRPFNPDFPLSLLLDYTYISDIADGVIRSIDRPLGYQVREDRDVALEREGLWIWRGGKGRWGEMGREVIVWISKMLLDSVLQREMMDLIDKKRKEKKRWGMMRKQSTIIMPGVRERMRNEEGHVIKRESFIYIYIFFYIFVFLLPQVINLGNGRPFSLKDFIALVETCVGKKAKIQVSRKQ